MIKRRVFKRSCIYEALDTLNIKYLTYGPDYENNLHFCSLRKREPNGIYFAEIDIDHEHEISGSLILVKEKYNIRESTQVVVENPQLTFYKLMSYFFDSETKNYGIHPTAIVSDNCVINPKSWIGPYCVLDGCTIEEGVILKSHVTVMPGTYIAKNVVVESSSNIGISGAAWAWDTEAGRKVIQPQIGYTYIGEGCFLASDTGIARGSVNETTTIGKNSVIAQGTKIGHGSIIGSECHLASNVSIAGNVTLGDRCFLGSGVTIRPQTALGSDTVVGVGSVVVKSILESNMLLMGVPAKASKVIKTKLSGVPNIKTEG